MNKSRLFGALLVSAAMIAVHATAADAPAAGPPGASAFGALPAISDVSMSPNGTKLAFVAAQGDTQAVVIENVDGSHPMVVPGKEKIRGVSWASNDVALVAVSVTSDAKKELDHPIEFWRTIAIDVNTRKSIILKAGFDSVGNSRVTIDSTTFDAQGHVVVAAFDYDDSAYVAPTDTRLRNTDAEMDAFVMEAIQIDPKTNENHAIAKGTKYTTAFAYTASGQVVARSDYNPNSRIFAIYAPRGGGWRKVMEIDGLDEEKVSLLNAEPGTGNVLLLDRRGEKLAIQRLDMTTGAVTTALETANRPPIGSVFLDRFTSALVAVYEAGDIDEWRWIDPQLADLHKKLQAAFPNKVVDIDDWTADRKKVLFRVYGSSTPTTYYVIDLTTMHADIVGDQYPQLADVKMGEKISITYAARDGTKIPAYLTLPPGKTAKNLPLVILPHGGPAGSDSPDFDYWAQDLATHGYAVLQPQFRGSTGYGAAWEQAGWRQWGGLMQDDLTDGVKYLISTGQVDPKRVCIAGASYGGYAALAGATMTPDLYACAVSISGPSNLPELRGYVQGADDSPSESMAYESHNIGDKFDPKVKAVSPVYLTRNVKAPILIIQGLDDTVVPFSQADEMVKALQQDGKAVTFVQLPGEDHWWSRAATRVQIMKTTDDFLAKYLGS
jgi:dipeptidyl aminopeptidase/acylaminoacyl peptidase